MIASAVVVPELEDVPKNETPSLKRRQSSLDSDSSKRPRLDTQVARPSTDIRSPPTATSPPRRRSAVGAGAAEEKKRGQRLFGALLGTLSQASAKPAHRRRDEIEKRQQERQKQKEDEDEEAKRRKREELDASRRGEQKTWDEQSARLRHRYLRITAHFLKTKCEPPLYFKPWELRPEEDDRIKQQIEDTEKLINDEVTIEKVENEPVKVQEPTEPSSNSAERPQAQAEDVNMDGEQKPELVGEDATNEQDPVPEPRTTDDTPIEPPRPESKDEHHGEELVEGQEDDVIY